MITTHVLGFPRIGAQRELKQALEAYWRGEGSAGDLQETGRRLRLRHWRNQRDAGLDFVCAGDFSFYDTVLDHACLFGAIPERFGAAEACDLDTYFRMARGRSRDGAECAALEMTKWFDTNYHYLVPELHPGQHFRLTAGTLLEQVAEAQAEGMPVKPVLIGPLTFLWLAKTRAAAFDKLSLLDALLPVYGELLARLHETGVEWVQLDEPVLALDLPRAWKNAFEQVYSRLRVGGLKTLLATYFGGLEDNLGLACRLPVDGLHLDLVRAPEQLAPLLDHLPGYKVVSLGVIDGRNIWRADLDALGRWLAPVRERLGERLWLAPSCSLLHVPLDSRPETTLPAPLRRRLSFALQKLDELASLKSWLGTSRAEPPATHAPMPGNTQADDAASIAVPEAEAQRAAAYAERRQAQRAALALPAFPTTTIGSFPQTDALRRARHAWRCGQLSDADYQETLRAQVRDCIARQEHLDLDVLVHGEAERSDMVEYFGEQLDGFALTRHGWVQSYGSRCVRPPIIHADVARPGPMTLAWTRYAQSLTRKPVKGMLTGPVTLLQWSFVRDDQPRETTCTQIALALREEVIDLERAGIGIIQIDEPAFREGLPLRKAARPAYLAWATRCFRIACAAVENATQIHTHMCYAEFNDIIDAIAALDADVITIETSRSDTELLDAFSAFDYPNEIGPGVYDIHSPRLPQTADMVALLRRAARRIPAERLWVNPDCGLKTRAWPEVEAALQRMVEAARQLRDGRFCEPVHSSE